MAEIISQFQFSPPGGLWRHLQIISSFRELQYGHLDTLNIKIHPLSKEIQAEQVGCKIRDGTAAAGQPPVLYWILKVGETFPIYAVIFTQPFEGSSGISIFSYTNKSKQVLIMLKTIPYLQGIVLTVNSMSLDKCV